MRATCGLLLLTAVVLLAGSACSSGSKHAEQTTSTEAHRKVSHVPATRRRPLRLVERPLARLPAPLQDSAAAASGFGAVVAGGLDSADTSVDGIRYVSARGDARRTSLPGARHDAAAATIDGRTYVFGGGDGVRQLDEIVDVGRGATARASAMVA